MTSHGHHHHHTLPAFSGGQRITRPNFSDELNVDCGDSVLTNGHSTVTNHHCHHHEHHSLPSQSNHFHDYREKRRSWLMEMDNENVYDMVDLEVEDVERELEEEITEYALLPIGLATLEGSTITSHTTCLVDERPVIRHRGRKRVSRRPSGCVFGEQKFSQTTDGVGLLSLKEMPIFTLTLGSVGRRGTSCGATTMTETECHYDFIGPEKKCVCCPYGYHVEVDFVDHANQVKQGKNLHTPKLNRPHSNRLQSTPNLAPPNGYSQLLHLHKKPSSYRNQGSSSSIDPRFFDELDDSFNSVASDVGSVMGSLAPSQSEDDTFATFGTTTHRAQEIHRRAIQDDSMRSSSKRTETPELQPALQLGNNRRTETPELQPALQLGNNRRTETPELQPAHQLGNNRRTETPELPTANEAALEPHRVESPLPPPLPESPPPSLPPDDSVIMTKEQLQRIREELKQTLMRQKDLEEQLKAVPVLQVRINVLKEEKRALLANQVAKKLGPRRSVGIGVYVQQTDQSTDSPPQYNGNEEVLVPHKIANDRVRIDSKPKTPVDEVDFPAMLDYPLPKDVDRNRPINVGMIEKSYARRDFAEHSDDDIFERMKPKPQEMSTQTQIFEFKDAEVLAEMKTPPPPAPKPKIKVDKQVETEATKEEEKVQLRRNVEKELRQSGKWITREEMTSTMELRLAEQRKSLASVSTPTRRQSTASRTVGLLVRPQQRDVALAFCFEPKIVNSSSQLVQSSASSSSSERERVERWTEESSYSTSSEYSSSSSTVVNSHYSALTMIQKLVVQYGVPRDEFMRLISMLLHRDVKSVSLEARPESVNTSEGSTGGQELERPGVGVGEDTTQVTVTRWKDMVSVATGYRVPYSNKFSFTDRIYTYEASTNTKSKDCKHQALDPFKSTVRHVGCSTDQLKIDDHKLRHKAMNTQKVPLSTVGMETDILENPAHIERRIRAQVESEMRILRHQVTSLRQQAGKSVSGTELKAVTTVDCGSEFVTAGSHHEHLHVQRHLEVEPTSNETWEEVTYTDATTGRTLKQVQNQSRVQGQVMREVETTRVEHCHEDDEAQRTKTQRTVQHQDSVFDPVEDTRLSRFHVGEGYARTAYHVQGELSQPYQEVLSPPPVAPRRSLSVEGVNSPISDSPPSESSTVQTISKSSSHHQHHQQHHHDSPKDTDSRIPTLMSPQNAAASSSSSSKVTSFRTAAPIQSQSSTTSSVKISSGDGSSQITTTAKTTSSSFSSSTTRSSILRSSAHEHDEVSQEDLEDLSPASFSSALYGSGGKKVLTSTVTQSKTLKSGPADRPQTLSTKSEEPLTIRKNIASSDHQQLSFGSGASSTISSSSKSGSGLLDSPPTPNKGSSSDQPLRFTTGSSSSSFSSSSTVHHHRSTADEPLRFLGGGGGGGGGGGSAPHTLKSSRSSSSSSQQPVRSILKKRNTLDSTADTPRSSTSSEVHATASTVTVQDEASSSLLKRGISFASDVVGGSADTLDDFAALEDQANAESLEMMSSANPAPVVGAEDDEDSDESEASADEGCYDGRLGEITWKSQQMSVEDTEPVKLELPAELSEACHRFCSWLEDSTTTSSKDMNAAMSIIRREWFRVSSTPTAEVRQVEFYINTFQKASPQLLERVVNMDDSNGNTCCHYAVSHGQWQVVEVLLATSHCNVNAPNKAGYSALMLASLSKVQSPDAYDTIRKLLEAGDVNARATQSRQTCLMLASSHNRADMVQLLLDLGADPNLRDDEGSTALMCASEHGHVEAVRTLLNCPALDTEITDNEGSSATSVALDANHRDVALLIYARQNLGRNAGSKQSRKQLRRRYQRLHRSPASSLIPRSSNSVSSCSSGQSSSGNESN